MSFIALLGPFVGLILGFDAINSERIGGTLNRLVSNPIHRDSIIIGKFLAGIVYLIDTQWNALLNSYNNYVLELNLNRISPYYLYSEAVSTIMNPSVRTVNVVTYNQLDGAISGYFSFGQSLLLVWPHLVALFALMLASFVGAYIGFMRQEIRSN